MTFDIDKKVMHNSMPQWGLGNIVGVNGDKVSVNFNIVGEKVIIHPSRYLTEIEDDACVLCLKGCVDGSILSNGSIYHEKCYKEEIDKVVTRNKKESELHQLKSELNQCCKAKNDVSDELLRIQKNIERINRSSIVTALYRVFNSKRIVDLLNLKKYLQHELSLNRSKVIDVEAKITSLKQEIASIVISNRLDSLHDYWLSYPPDWEERRESILAGAVCEECGRDRSLHVHHIIPISKGGSHREENLIVLCEACHSKEHGGRVFQYSSDSKPTSFQKKLNLIREAISSGKMLSFHYRKYDGEHSDRIIGEIIFKRVESTLCICGFCYTRKDQRTFAVKRMSKLSIVE